MKACDCFQDQTLQLSDQSVRACNAVNFKSPSALGAGAGECCFKACPAQKPPTFLPFATRHAAYARIYTGNGSANNTVAKGEPASTHDTAKCNAKAPFLNAKFVMGELDYQNTKLSRMIKNGRLAFVVLLYNLGHSGMRYLRALIRSLKKVAGSHEKTGGRYATGIAPVVALATPNVARSKEAIRCLRSLGVDKVVEAPLVEPCPTRDRRYAKVFTKLLVWNMTMYDRLVVLDNDMIVLENIDELFAYDYFAAAHDWPTNPPRLGVCGATSDISYKRGGFNPIKSHNMNGGLLIVQPSVNVLNEMAREMTPWNLKSTGQYHPRTCQAAEQRFLNHFFRYNYENRSRGWFTLPAEVYNVRLLLAEQIPHLLVHPKIMHYVGSKPLEDKPSNLRGGKRWSTHGNQLVRWLRNKFHTYDQQPDEDEDQVYKCSAPTIGSRAADAMPSNGPTELADVLGMTLGKGTLKQRQKHCQDPSHAEEIHPLAIPTRKIKE